MCSIKFERGFSSVRKKTVKSSKYTRDCSNCRFYYQTQYDSEELCQNPSVLEYDVTTDGGRVFCSYWQNPSSPQPKNKVEEKPSKTDWYKFERNK